MNVTDGRRIVADFKVVSVAGMPGIGFHRLQFSLEVGINALQDEPARIHEPRAFVLAGSPQSGMQPLGVAIAETQWSAETIREPSRTYFMVFLDLTGEQLSALERVRAGDPLCFRLDLHTLVESRRFGLQRGLVQSSLEVPVSSWGQILKAFGFSEILLVALDLPTSDVPASLLIAVDQLRGAHADFVGARYDRAVAACRLAVDAVDAALANGSQVEQAFKDYAGARGQMSKRQRALLVSGAVRHYTHLGHHLNSIDQLEIFSRQDAQFVLAATSAVLWDAISELKLGR